jgi:hypothetical protein
LLWLMETVPGDWPAHPVIVRTDLSPYHLLGLGQLDWGLEWFQGLFVQFGAEVPPMPDPRVILGAMFITTLTVGKLFNLLWCFGEELGWRGYLLPKLMPLGKPIAYLVRCKYSISASLKQKMLAKRLFINASGKMNTHSIWRLNYIGLVYSGKTILRIYHLGPLWSFV